MDNNKLPEEFYKSTNFYTLAGTAGAVWLLCIVVGSLDIENKLLPIYYRIIAIVVSMVISIIMTFRKEIIKAEYWLFAFFNGLLIFVNASGLNAITSNQKFGYSIENNKKNVTNIQKETDMSYASFFDFKIKNVSWWEDNSLYEENKVLMKQNNDLRMLNRKIVSENELIHKINDSNYSKYIHSKSIVLPKDNEKSTSSQLQSKINSLLQINIKNELIISDLNNSLSKLKEDIKAKNLALEKLNQPLEKKVQSNDCALQIRKLNLEMQALKDKYIQCMDNYNNH